MSEGAFEALPKATRDLLNRTVVARPGRWSLLKPVTVAAFSLGSFWFGAPLAGACLALYAVDKSWGLLKDRSTSQDSEKLVQVIAENNQTITRLSRYETGNPQREEERVELQGSYIDQLQLSVSVDNAAKCGNAEHTGIMSADPDSMLTSNLLSTLVQEAHPSPEGSRAQEPLSDEVELLRKDVVRLSEDKLVADNEIATLQEAISQSEGSLLNSHEKIHEQETEINRLTAEVKELSDFKKDRNSQVSEHERLVAELEKIRPGHDKWEQLCQYNGDSTAVRVEDLVKGLQEQKEKAEKWGQIEEMLKLPNVKLNEDTLMQTMTNVFVNRPG